MAQDKLKVNIYVIAIIMWKPLSESEEWSSNSEIESELPEVTVSRKSLGS